MGSMNTIRIYLLLVLFLVRSSLQMSTMQPETEDVVTNSSILSSKKPSSTVSTVSASTSPRISSSKLTTATTTTPAFIIGTVSKATTKAGQMKSYHSACGGFSLKCPNQLTVIVDEVYNGRKINSSCSPDIPECCDWARDDTTECLFKSPAIKLVTAQRCLANPGKSCIFASHSAFNIPCQPAPKLSHFTAVEFHCEYVPIPTNIVESTSNPTSNGTVTSSLPSSTEASSATQSPAKGTTPKPLPVAIIAGAAGGGVGLILLIILIVCCARRCHQRRMKQDMTKADPGVNPVYELGVNYVDEENSKSEPDVIKTLPNPAVENLYSEVSVKY